MFSNPLIVWVVFLKDKVYLQSVAVWDTVVLMHISVKKKKKLSLFNLGEFLLRFIFYAYFFTCVNVLKVHRKKWTAKCTSGWISSSNLSLCNLMKADNFNNLSKQTNKKSRISCLSHVNKCTKSPLSIYSKNPFCNHLQSKNDKFWIISSSKD